MSLDGCMTARNHRSASSDRSYRCNTPPDRVSIMLSSYRGRRSGSGPTPGRRSCEGGGCRHGFVPSSAHSGGHCGPGPPLVRQLVCGPDAARRSYFSPCAMAARPRLPRGRQPGPEPKSTPNRAADGIPPRYLAGRRELPAGRGILNPGARDRKAAARRSGRSGRPPR